MIHILTFLSVTFAAQASDLAKPPIAGPFTKAIEQLAASFNDKTWDKLPKETLQCFFVADQPESVGLLQFVTVAAPIEQVKKALDDIPAYINLLPDYKKIELTEAKDETAVTSWEKKIPIPFPNLVYQLIHTARPLPNGRVSRYQLLTSEKMTYSDGLMAISADPKDAAKTRLFRIDYWDSKMGFSRWASITRIRRDGAAGIYQATLAFQFKAEGRAKEDKDIRKLANKALDDKLLDQCAASEKKFDLNVLTN